MKKTILIFVATVIVFCVMFVAACKSGEKDNPVSTYSVAASEQGTDSQTSDIIPVKTADMLFYDELFTDVSANVRCVLNVTDTNKKQGVAALYNDEKTLPDDEGGTSYYLFATESGRAKLQMFYGGKFIELARKTLIGFTAGEHVYIIKISKTGVECYLDGEGVISVGSSDFSAVDAKPLANPGRVCAYS
ncbi:MAG: hypothetical protein IJU84_08015, partial [Clostridia bacterium]|nr:hypothetical protein [Clostridia bacterium]